MSGQTEEQPGSQTAEVDEWDNVPDVRKADAIMQMQQGHGQEKPQENDEGVLTLTGNEPYIKPPEQDRLESGKKTAVGKADRATSEEVAGIVLALDVLAKSAARSNQQTEQETLALLEEIGSRTKGRYFSQKQIRELLWNSPDSPDLALACKQLIVGTLNGTMKPSGKQYDAAWRLLAYLGGPVGSRIEKVFPAGNIAMMVVNILKMELNLSVTDLDRVKDRLFDELDQEE